ncbi:hypothetical protein FLP41_02695 (plasmid) [Paracoccus marcusii]|uniref:hypothetical protein n=1 Tax=Paracoccus marcusii TaxID=59779 RepID=UPI002ED6B610|nr:hypothetical protein FLP41_02695 [Paracoccus marcusii]
MTKPWRLALLKPCSVEMMRRITLGYITLTDTREIALIMKNAAKHYPMADLIDTPPHPVEPRPRRADRPYSGCRTDNPKVRQTSVISAIFHRIILAKVRMVRHWPAAGTRRDMT